MIIAIDGPSASGKSTVAQKLAERMNFYCMSTGAMYRAAAYVAQHVLGYDEISFQEVTHDQLDQLLMNGRLYYEFIRGSCAQMFFDNNDLSKVLKDPVISQGASIIAANKDIRSCLTKYFQRAARGKNIVVEGRDIGTVVFPDAQVKFFLTADIKTRAERWQNMLESKGISLTYQQALTELEERDGRDRSRNIAPLIIAPDALIIDNSHMTIDETVQQMIDRISQVER